MPNWISSILDAIGNTPLLKVNIEHENEVWHFYAKLEFLNPSGSIKDRVAKYVITLNEANKTLKPDSIIVEATSGNTGISFAMVSAVKGYRCIIVMPENVSLERQRIITMLGAEVCLTPAEEFYLGAMKKTKQMAQNNPNVFLPCQFENYDDVLCHYYTTAEEILNQTKGLKIDAFVAGVGTGATLMGIGKRLREVYPDCKIVAVEPKEAALLNGCREPLPHEIAGIGSGFIPPIVDPNKIDWCEAIASDEAITMTRKISAQLGVMVGVSTGANILGTINVLKKLGKDKNIVTVFPDRSDRYFSTNLYLKKSDSIIRNCRIGCENPFC
ncbi:MAG: cysteine synthase family protein [candidate division WOR-3 bacterium]|nr:cysteine synthase family protein [candidate division WOR-3 bacterium]MCX7756874.1 cysteine synthase family protein [candidate division WOR-3 bacterium]MDW7987402.1 cysteine synthase family protein [candidate division WOR-3 bacterium]